MGNGHLVHANRTISTYTYTNSNSTVFFFYGNYLHTKVVIVVRRMPQPSPPHTHLFQVALVRAPRLMRTQWNKSLRLRQCRMHFSSKIMLTIAVHIINNGQTCCAWRPSVYCVFYWPRFRSVLLLFYYIWFTTLRALIYIVLTRHAISHHFSRSLIFLVDYFVSIDGNRTMYMYTVLIHVCTVCSIASAVWRTELIVVQLHWTCVGRSQPTSKQILPFLACARARSLKPRENRASISFSFHFKLAVWRCYVIPRPTTSDLVAYDRAVSVNTITLYTYMWSEIWINRNPQKI